MLQDRNGKPVMGISASSVEIELLASGLLASRWSPFDGPEPILAGILDGTLTVKTNLPEELQIDYILGNVVHKAIQRARDEGRREGRIEVRRDLIERLGLA